MFRHNINLNKKQVDFINNIRKEIKDSTGKKLGKDATVRAILKAIISLKIDICKIKSEKEFEKELIRYFNNK